MDSRFANNNKLAINLHVQNSFFTKVFRIVHKLFRIEQMLEWYKAMHE